MDELKIENPDVTDYSNLLNWLSLPDIPLKPADVFYIYPKISGLRF